MTFLSSSPHQPSQPVRSLWAVSLWRKENGLSVRPRRRFRTSCSAALITSPPARRLTKFEKTTSKSFSESRTL